MGFSPVYPAFEPRQTPPLLGLFPDLQIIPIKIVFLIYFVGIDKKMD